MLISTIACVLPFLPCKILNIDIFYEVHFIGKGKKRFQSFVPLCFESQMTTRACTTGEVNVKSKSCFPVLMSCKTFICHGLLKC